MLLPTTARSAPASDSLARSGRTSATAAAAACTRGATRSSSARQRAGAGWCSWAKGPGADEDAQGLPFVGRAGQLLTQMIEGTARKEGIPIKRERRLHLQRGEVPAAGQPHAANRTRWRSAGSSCPGSCWPSARRPSARWAPRRPSALPGSKDGVTKLRGNWYKWRGHPGDGRPTTPRTCCGLQPVQPSAKPGRISRRSCTSSTTEPRYRLFRVD